MGFVEKLISSAGKSPAPQDADSREVEDSTADDALTTLSTVIGHFGACSFPLDDEIDPELFRAQCAELARHLEHCAPAPALGLNGGSDGTRQWGLVQRFFVDRRQQELDFVEKRTAEYRDVVNGLVAGLRELGTRHSETAVCVQRNLQAMESAVATGVMPEIKATLNEIVRSIDEGFARQQQQYECRIGELTQRMSSLRQDLATVRGELTRDTLTQAYSRGAFDKVIVHNLNLNFILQQPVMLILLDLDQLKVINDNFGHAAGDGVLRAFGEILAGSFVRKTDFVARVDGDEFAVILPDTNAANAAALLGRFYDALPELSLACELQDTQVTCSAGYTEFMPGDTADSVLKRANAALSDAKQNGRNSVEYL